jgi:hypothetical protein
MNHRLTIMCILATCSLGCEKSKHPGNLEASASTPTESKLAANTPMSVNHGEASTSSVPPPVTTSARQTGSRIRTPDGHEIMIPPGEQATIEVRSKHNTTSATRDVTRTATSTGVGLDTESDQAAIKFKPEAATANLPPEVLGASPGSGGGGSSGGGAAFDGDLMAAAKKITLFYFLGAGLLIAAGAYWWLNKINPAAWKTALLIALAGIVNIGVGVVVNEYPWVFLVSIVSGLVLAGVWFWGSRQHTVTTAGATKIVKAVDTLPPVHVTPDMVGKPLNLKKLIKDHIEVTAGPADKLVRRVVTDIKNKISDAEVKADKITNAPHA